MSDEVESKTRVGVGIMKAGGFFSIHLTGDEDAHDAAYDALVVRRAEWPLHASWSQESFAQDARTALLATLTQTPYTVVPGDRDANFDLQELAAVARGTLRAHNAALAEVTRTRAAFAKATTEGVPRAAWEACAAEHRVFEAAFSKALAEHQEARWALYKALEPRVP